MFPKTKNIETSFQLIRTTCIVVIVCSFSLDGWVCFKAFHELRSAQSKVYVLASGKVLEAVAGDRKDNLPAEARDHIVSYHKYFFTLDPDEKVINENLSKALCLVDGSGRRVYENLKETGYYASVVNSYIIQRISIDSVRLDMGSEPYYFQVYARETIERPTSIVTRSLLTEGWLRNVSRSDNNSHGLMIERWSVVENRDLKTENK